MQKRTSLESGGSHKKKVKFDPHHAGHLAPERRVGSSRAGRSDTSDAVEDELMETDVGIGATHRKRVNTDGYGSDSSLSEDELDAGTRRGRGRTDKAPTLENESGPMDEDDDMFGEPPSRDADLDEMHPHDSAGKGNGKGKGKQKDFLDLQDIEGQDFSTERQYMDIVDEDNDDDEVEAELHSHGVESAARRHRLHRQDDVGDEEVDDEVGALGRKHNAPKLDSFNMKAEMEDGQFDQDGNYIRAAKDKQDSQDDWLKDVSRKDIQRAREAQAKRRQDEMDRMDEDVASLGSTGEMLSELIDFLQTGETLLEALQRHGGARQSAQRHASRRQRKQEQAIGNVAATEDTAERRSIRRISAIADKLMSGTEIEVYDSERERLIRQYKAITGRDYRPIPANGQDAAQAGTEKQWEFYWAGAEDSINGPYGQGEMHDWWQDGHFKQAEAYARPAASGEDHEWQRITDDENMFDSAS